MNVSPIKSSKKKVFYSRVSSADQNDLRQLQNLDNYDYVLKDKCSGLIPLWERPNGSQIKKLVDAGDLELLEVHSIDRLGRSTLNVLGVWKQLTELGITVICRNPSLKNFDEQGKPDKVSEMILTILATMSTFEKQLIRERQMEGIAVRKAKNLYTGRSVNTKDTPEKFLNKPKIKKILAKLEDGYTHAEITKILGCSYSTIRKAVFIHKIF